MARLGLTARALWWRRGASLTLLTVATVTTAAAALGPVYARAAGESTLRDALVQAPSSATGLTFTGQRDVSQRQSVDDFNAGLPPVRTIAAYPVRINEIQTSGSAFAVGGTGPVATRVVWRAGQCAHLVMVSGRCPAADGEAIVSIRTLSGGYGVRLGSTLDLGGLHADQLGPDGVSVPVDVRVTIVGTYTPRDPSESYWFGRAYFNAHLYPGKGDGPDTIDTVFVDKSLFPTLSRPSLVTVVADYPLDPTAVRLGDEAGLRGAVDRLLGSYGAGSSVPLHAGVLAVLTAADAARADLDVSTILVTVQLALLAWLVLFQVMADAAEARGTEIALAKLRGLGPLATLRFGLGEPLSLLALSVPLGLLGGWAAIAVMSRVVLLPGTPVALDLPAVGGALVGFAGGAVAAALAARRTLTRPVLEQWRRVPQDSPAAWPTLVLDLLVVAAAVAGLVALRSGHGSGQARPASLLGPGLAVLAVGLLGVRLLPFFGRAGFAPTRASAHVGIFLAVRQVVRRPAGLRLAALLAVAIGLATFAVDSEAVAAGNRADRAAVEVGASQVVSTGFSVAHNPVDVVAAVDPGGQWAMAAATWLPSGGPVAGSIVAVDPARLSAVALWPVTHPGGGGLLAQPSVTTVASAIGPPVPAPVTITGTAVRVQVSVLSAGAGPPPDLQIELRPLARRAVDVSLGALRGGTHSYSAVVPCSAGCTLQRLVIDRPIDFFAVMTGTLVVRSIDRAAASGWAGVDARLTSPGQWRAAGSPASSDSVTARADGLHDTYTSTGGASPALGHIDSPIPVPVVATANAIVRDSTAGPSVMLDITNTALAFQEVATVPLLPVALDHAVIVDLAFIRSQLPDFDSEAHWQIWLGAGAPSDAVHRLQAAGLVVQSVTSQRDRSAQLGRQGTALALALLVACALAGAALAAGATALAVAVTGRRRSFELAALAAVGVSRAVLWRSCVLEQLILLGTGFVLGLPTGIVAARLALPEIPEFSDQTPVPLDYAPHVLAVAVFGVAVVALLVATAAVAGHSLMRAAVPTRLREAAP